MEEVKTASPVTLSKLAEETAVKIEAKTAKIGIVGLGYVGLPLALEFSRKGFQTYGLDIAKDKVDILRSGGNYIDDVNEEDLRDTVKRGVFTPTTDFSVVPELDVMYICVPSPFTENKEPDITAILSAGRAVAKGLRKGQLVILKSTTFPGTTEDYLRPVLEEVSGLKAGKDFFLAFSPERVDPGNKRFTTANTPIVVGGMNADSTELGVLANRQIIEKVYRVSNPKVAEMEKLLENIFRSVNIALVNELALLCERMNGLNIWEVVEAAGTKPFGFMKFMPGPGVGGHCIPIDPYYLSWLARAYDFETKFITLSANVNESMPYHVRDLVIREISRMPITVQDAKIMILGFSFKKNVRDLRHSPSESIIRLLFGAGANSIAYNDPYVPEIEIQGNPMKSVPITKENLSLYDVVVLVTDHDDYDLDFILANSKRIVDTRNATARCKDNQSKKIVLLGRKN